MKFEFKAVKDIIDDSFYFDDVKYGLYCWRLSDKSKFNDFENDNNNRILYTGKADNYIADRFYNNHLSNYANFSTFRRSIGSVLKKELSLEAIPRLRKDGSISSYTNFSFSKNGEFKIDQWIIDNLEYGFIELNNNLNIEHKEFMVSEEEKVKEITKPCLNCSNGDNRFNIYFSKIRDLRKICADEARKYKIN
tara:strand:- start:1302 stop:1880 length:579 start_codon:yes stop_codon:yes gene_type:complete